MNARTHHKPIAAALAAVAALAFVLTPVLHAELHVREAEQQQLARSAAFDHVFQLVFAGRHGDSERVELERQLTRALDGWGPPHVHFPGDIPHDDGSLQHFAAAVLVAPPRPALAPRAPVARFPIQQQELTFILPAVYLVEQSQGPPRA